MDKKIIGRNELINIPEFDLYDIEAKIDTGAYRGSIHASDIEEFTDSDGKSKIRFKILDGNHPEFKDRYIVTENFTKVKVRNSEINYIDRYAIPLEIELAGQKIKSYFSLSNRNKMRRPILIGRKVLRDRFIVDVSQNNNIKK